MKTVAEFYEEIYPTLEKIEQERLSSLTKGNIIITVGVIIVVFIVIPMFIAMRDAGEFSSLFTLIILIVFSGVTSLYRRQQFSVKSTYKHEVISKIVEAVDSNFVYQPYGQVVREYFNESRLFSEPDRYSGEDYISGRLGETDFQLSEIHAEYKSGSDYEDGSSSYSTIFKGFFMVADFHQDFQGHTIVVPDNKAVGIWGRIQQAIKSQGMETAEMEDVDFEDKFDVFTTDQEEARNILSMSMIENIVKLKEKFDSKIYIAFLNSCIYIAIEWKLNIFEPNLHSTLLDENTIHGFLDEIWMCLEIIEDLDLNKKIWTKA
jgi:hypothetical protein